jgi:hypothetical protein
MRLNCAGAKFEKKKKKKKKKKKNTKKAQNRNQNRDRYGFIQEWKHNKYRCTDIHTHTHREARKSAHSHHGIGTYHQNNPSDASNEEQSNLGAASPSWPGRVRG